MREKEGEKEERPRIEYRHPYLTEDKLAPIYAAYGALTGRAVYAGVRLQLVLSARVHGPDLIPLMEDLHARYGVDDLLKRLLHHPPRQVFPSPGTAAVGSARRADPESGSAFNPDEVRISPAQQNPETDWSAEPAPAVAFDEAALLPGLLYGESDRPPFDPTSRRRWDDRPSNPDRDAILAERTRRSGRAAVGSET